MKTGIKIGVCGVLLASAATMAAFTAADISRAREPAARMDETSLGASRYVLGEYGGRAAVFASGDFTEPVLVTNIQTASLRENDRLKLAAGIAVGSEEELARLLEDLGS